MMLKITKKIKKPLLGVLSLMTFFFFSLFQGLFVLQLKNLNFSSSAILYANLFYSLIILIVVSYIFKDLIIKSFNDLKKNHFEYFKTYLPYWFIALFLMGASNLFIHIVIMGGLDVSEIASNEDALRNVFSINPIAVYISAVIFAPLIEELVFRGSFYYMFKNKILFLFFSGFTFGFIHVLGAETWQQFMFIIPYSIPGFIFAYALYKSKNIFVPIGLHFIHNGVLMAIQMILLITGVDI